MSDEKIQIKEECNKEIKRNKLLISYAEDRISEHVAEIQGYKRRIAVMENILTTIGPEDLVHDESGLLRIKHG